MSNVGKKSAACILIVALLASVVSLGGCGKKAPPIAPRQSVMEAVADLTVQYGGGVVDLAWNHRPSAAVVNAYVVYRAQQDRDASDCQGCPMLFEKVGTLSLDPTNDTERQPLFWSQNVSIGFRYTFKVVPVISSGSRGPDSNLVLVEAFN